jgi:hypothetical protein
MDYFILYFRQLYMIEINNLHIDLELLYIISTCHFILFFMLVDVNNLDIDVWTTLYYFRGYFVCVRARMRVCACLCARAFAWNAL